jgi:hypothetical protein
MNYLAVQYEKTFSGLKAGERKARYVLARSMWGGRSRCRTGPRARVSGNGTPSIYARSRVALKAVKPATRTRIGGCAKRTCASSGVVGSSPSRLASKITRAELAREWEPIDRPGRPPARTLFIQPARWCDACLQVDAPNAAVQALAAATPGGAMRKSSCAMRVVA